MFAAASKIRVFQVSKSNGGVGTYTRRLVKALNKERFEVTVACLSTDGENMAHELSQIPGVTAFSIPMAEYHIDPVSDIRVLYQLFNLIRNGKFDLIHAHTSKPGFFARLASIGSKIPVIYRPANFSFYDGVSVWKIVVYVLLERFAAHYLTNRIMMVSDGERNLARRYNVGRNNQFVLIRTGIDVELFNTNIDKKKMRDKFGIPADVPLVGTVARLTKDKAPFDFVEAAALVHARHPTAHFIWIGDGPLDDQLRKKIEVLKLENIFHMAGHQTNVHEYLRAMDCFVLSSTSEALSIAMLEAMASGLPVISTRVNGADEAIRNGETGLLVPIGDVSSMANAINYLIDDPLRARAIGNAARECISEEFSLSKMTQQVEELYEEVFRESKKS